MATVRAQRFLNNVLNGTVGATALQTALGDPSTRADWQQVTSERGKARVIAATTNGANAVGGSVTATEDYISSIVGPQEILRNTNRFSKSQIGATVGASNDLMGFWTANQNLLSASQRSILGKDIYTSQFAVDFGNKIFDARANDGRTWTVFLPPFEELPQVTGSASDFAVSDDESILIYLQTSGAASNTPCVRRSTNMGATFSAPTSISSTPTFGVRSIDFGAGLFVVVGDDGKIFSSPDGITWTQRTSGHTSQLQRVVYDNGVFVAAGTNNVMTSVDGITWVNRSAGFGSTCNCIHFVGNNTWLTAFQTSAILRSTNNGTSWTQVGLVAGLASTSSFASDGTGHVLGGHTGTTLTASLDFGATWSNLGAVTGLGGVISGLAFYGGVYLVKSASNSNLVVSAVPQPIINSASPSFYHTNNFTTSANGYNLLGRTFADPGGDLFAVKKGRLFVKSNTPFMFYRGQ